MQVHTTIKSLSVTIYTFTFAYSFHNGLKVRSRNFLLVSTFCFFMSRKIQFLELGQSVYVSVHRITRVYFDWKKPKVWIRTFSKLDFYHLLGDSWQLEIYLLLLVTKQLFTVVTKSSCHFVSLTNNTSRFFAGCRRFP